MLLNAGSVLVAVTAFAAASGTVASAQDEGLSVVGNVGLVSDYRFRGVSLSDNTIALQGGFDLATPSGFYVGTWGSTIEAVSGPTGGDSELELDLYGGYLFEAGMFTFDVGVLAYTYPGAEDLWYYEPYASATTTLADLVTLTGGVAWAPEQDNLSDEDNTYFYLDGSMPLGDSPFSLTGHVGYEDGILASFFDDAGEDDKTDWSIGVSTTILGLGVGLSYVDTTEDGELTDAVGVLSISKAL
jgi:uncharacterized protein (TIGR02001 family)